MKQGHVDLWLPIHNVLFSFFFFMVSINFTYPQYTSALCFVMFDIVCSVTVQVPWLSTIPEHNVAVICSVL